MGWYEYDSDEGYEYHEASWFYAVAVGHQTGIYTRYQDAMEQVNGFPNFCMQKFGDFEDARDFMEEFEIYCDSLTDGSDLEEEDEGEANQDNWFYAVAVGRSTGIFLDLQDARDQVYGYPRSRMEAFLEYEEAQKFIENNQIVFVDEEEKEEKVERHVGGGNVWFYAVAVGRSTGVFMSYAKALEQVHGYSGFRMKKFRRYEEAEEYVVFNQIYSSDEEGGSDQEEEKAESWYYAVAVGRRVGIFTDHEEAMGQVHGYSGCRMKKFLDYDEAYEYISLNQNYSEEEEKSEEPEEQETWYYAVAVGRQVGVYTDHQYAMDQVRCYSGFRMKKFLDYSEAQEYIASNQVEISLDVEESDEETSVARDGEEGWFYAVAVGRCPGIYTDRENAIAQVHGYSGFRMKKFLDFEEAQEFVDFNRTYSSDEEDEESEESEEEHEADIWYYAVAVGRCTGVYMDWQIAMDQVRCYSGSRMKKFLSYSEAKEFVGGNQVFDNTADYESEEEEPEAEDGAETWYYAVSVGESKGIFTSLNDAVGQVRGVPGAKVYKYSSFESARAFLHEQGLGVENSVEYIDGSRLWFAYEAAGSDEDDLDPKHPDAMVAFCCGRGGGNGERSCNAGYACIFPHDRAWDIRHALETWATTNQAEYLAILAALRRANTEDEYEGEALHIYTNSAPMFNTMTSCIFTWKRNGWLEANGAEIPNRGVLELLVSTQGHRSVVWHYLGPVSAKRDWETCWFDVATDMAYNAA